MEPEAPIPAFEVALEKELAAHHLTILGGFHSDVDDSLPDWARTVLLIGPAEPGFWKHFTAQKEWQDGLPDPMDRWSKRVLDAIADKFDGRALFPFGDAPYHPFYSWALRTGQIWRSPVQLLIHAKQGLMVSFRGALVLKEAIHTTASTKPCLDCTQPCLSACPANALTQEAYDVPTCHRFLDTASGKECLSGGCHVRRACPVSQAYARLPEQSAYHMSRFHRAE